ncbi:MAG: GDP-mannose 4,6-dehydratase [Anaerolineales bacterium]
MRSLITGVGGFAGSHLADYLLAQSIGASDEVWGCDLSSTRRPFHPAALKLIAADLRDAAAVTQMIDQVRPDRIYHLAGQAYVGDSWSRPWETLENNLRPQVNLLEAVTSAGLKSRVLVVGSADEYGQRVWAGRPLDEDQPLRPDSPYGVSKVGQDMLGLQYFLSGELPVIRVRPFNHIGPRQNAKFVAPAFATQIAAIEAGRQPPVLRVGNLEARRDFTDVRDVVRAYALVLEQGEPGEVYNIGTGQSRGIRELLDYLLAMAQVPIEIRVETSRLRPVDLPDLVCDAGRLRRQTGWQPSVSFEQTLRDLLDYERGRLEQLPTPAAPLTPAPAPRL